MTRRQGRPPLRPRQPPPQGSTGQAGGDGHHRLPLPQGGSQLGEHPLHHLGLDAQNDVLRLGGGRPVVLGYGAPQLRRQGLRFGPGAVGDDHLLRPHGPARRLNQGRAHVSRSDKCRFFHPAPPFRIVRNQCFLFRPPVLFDGRLPPEGRPPVGTRLPVDHRQRPPAPGILGSPPPAVGRQTPLHIGGRCRCRGFRPRSGGYRPTSSWPHHSGRSSGNSSSSRKTAATALSYSPVSRAFRMALACRWLSPNRWMR